MDKMLDMHDEGEKRYEEMLNSRVKDFKQLKKAIELKFDS
jgi:hypothetical protein